ncbi:hypothetical protein EB061_12820 [bacterium]|nr:hypothetical protein [bacterium]
MNKALAVLIVPFFFAQASLAQSETLVMKCGAASDPDFIKMRLYKQGSTLVARLVEEYGDGEYGAVDVIELEDASGGYSLQGRVLSQVKDAHPRLASLEPGDEPSGRTRGALLTISPDGWAFFLGDKGPTGSSNPTYEMECKTLLDF